MGLMWFAQPPPPPPSSSLLIIFGTGSHTACIIASVQTNYLQQVPRDTHLGCLAASCVLIQTLLLDTCDAPLGLGERANKQNHCKTFPLVLLVGTSAQTQRAPADTQQEVLDDNTFGSR